MKNILLSVLVVLCLLPSCGSRKKATRIDRGYEQTTAVTRGVDAKTTTKITEYGDTLKMGSYIPAGGLQPETITGESKGIAFRATVSTQRDSSGHIKGHRIDVEAIAKPTSSKVLESEKVIRSASLSRTKESENEQVDEVRKSLAVPWWGYLILAGLIVYGLYRLYKLLKPF